MKALVTGCSGFVGTYLRAELEGHGYEVVGLSRKPGPGSVAADLTDAAGLKETVQRIRPELVFHLAGQANVALSWKEPQATFELNTLGALNLLEALRTLERPVTAVLVGSSDQYGRLGEAGVSVSEDTPMRPQTPYAVSKLAQEQLGQLYAGAYGLDVRMTRSFNHAGAGQREGFVIADFAAGIARIERGLADSLPVGALSARRDFTHVKDIVRAYRLIAEKGRAGEIYNVGSGRTYSAQDILDGLCALARCPIQIKQDPARLRPSDTPVLCCCRDKLTAHTGWRPEIPLETILEDTLNYYRQKNPL